jgi:hypothetical protein
MVRSPLLASQRSSAGRQMLTLSLHRKIPWRLSPTQKARQRKRRRAVDKVVETLSNALAKKGETLKSLERWKAEMPTEAEMLPRDKYTMFDRYAKRYRKGIHSALPFLPVVWDDEEVKGRQLTSTLLACRTSQVDSRVAESQPAWFLNDKNGMDGQLGWVYMLCTNTNGINGVWGICIISTATYDQEDQRRGLMHCESINHSLVDLRFVTWVSEMSTSSRRWTRNPHYPARGIKQDPTYPQLHHHQPLSPSPSLAPISTCHSRHHYTASTPAPSAWPAESPGPGRHGPRRNPRGTRRAPGRPTCRGRTGGPR